MPELKTICPAAIPEALDKALRYRLLNEPVEAESICLDVLRIDACNQQALVLLLLSITDQFVEETGDAVARAREILPRLESPYERAYYAGIISERRAKALLVRNVAGATLTAGDWFRDAMQHYQEAEASRPAGNDDALLRWNTCARILARNADLEQKPEVFVEMQLE
jgi:hypothetical protein